VELNTKAQPTICIVGQMDKLFEIDRKAREQGLSREDRHALRLEKSRPLLEEIKYRIEAARSGARLCPTGLSELPDQPDR
jgi:hypothetical protein